MRSARPGPLLRRFAAAGGPPIKNSLLSSSALWERLSTADVTSVTAEDWVYDALMVGAASACLARAWLIKSERLAWGLIGLALAVWTAGEIYYVVVFTGGGAIPIPSPADACYLLFYPLTYAGVIILARRRLDSFSADRWLDGIIVGA